MTIMCNAPTILFQGPMSLDGYDRSKPHSEQPSNVPIPFLEAMEVREEVFVKEQGVPLLMEADADDPRSCHWVAYGTLPKTTHNIPSGTIRLVPFPHDPHPLPGSSWDIDTDDEATELLPHFMPFIVDRPTTFHDGKEPYIKLGRWAVRKEFRGRGIAGLLAKKALDWAKENSQFFNRNPAEVKANGLIDASMTTWNGLVCVHAQEYLVEAWSKLGFKVDEGMGKWTEAGIPHVGMFLRLDVPKN